MLPGLCRARLAHAVLLVCYKGITCAVEFVSSVAARPGRMIMRFCASLSCIYSPIITCICEGLGANTFCVGTFVECQ